MPYLVLLPRINPQLVKHIPLRRHAPDPPLLHLGRSQIPRRVDVAFGPPPVHLLREVCLCALVLQSLGCFFEAEAVVLGRREARLH